MFAGAVAVTVLLLGWLGVQVWQARSALDATQIQAHRVQSAVLAGDQPAARAALRDLQAATERGRAATSGRVWAVAALLPWIGPNLAAVATVAAGADDLAMRAVPAALQAADIVDLSALAPVDGRVDLAPIVAVAPAVARAAEAAAAVDADLAALDTEELLDAIAGPLVTAQAQVHDLATDLRTAERATVLLPPMLGADGPRRYLLLFQTNAELRATGGLPGAMSVITADDGRLAMTAQGVAAGMPIYPDAVSPLLSEDRALFSDRLGRYMGDVNFTPDFPTAAGLAREMWRLHTGQEVDGVLATDPVALSYLLEATGPVSDGTGGELAAADAVDVLLSQAYERFPAADDQNAFFALVAANAFDAMTDGRADPAATVEALAHAAGERRLLLWSARDEERTELDGTVLEGAMPSGVGAAASVGVFFNDGTASKMDYYLDTAVAPVEAMCEPTGNAYGVRVVLANTAPADAATSLPSDVTGPGRSGLPAGDIRTNVVLLGPPHGRILAVTRDGRPVGVGSYSQDGRPATVLTVDLAPGETTQVIARLSGSATDDPLQLWTTPTKDQPGIVDAGGC